MKLIFYLIILFFINNCSFDNKSGIWKSETSISKKEKDIFKEFKKITIKENVYNETKKLKDNINIKISNLEENFKWNDIFFSDENNLKNFRYNEKNSIIFKSKKLSNSKVSNYILFENDNLITSDEKGNILIYSISEKKIISKFNFYKKRYKKYKKKLNIYVEENIIYVTDNIGYLYSFNYQNNEVLWAVNYKIPFKSNIKIFKNNIIASDINNNLIFFNKLNGDILKLFPTENTTITNQFVNNIAKMKHKLFFLNSYGSLYSIDGKNMSLDWFINLSPSLNLNQSNLFYGSEVVIKEGRIIVSSNNYTYLIDSNTGSILKKFNFSSVIKPLINNNLAFFVTKNDFLIAVNLDNFEILYSQNLISQVAKYLDSKEKNLNFKNMMLINNDIYLFLKNSFVLKFKNTGKLDSINKLPSRLKSMPIIIDSSILYLNFKNKLIIVD